MLMTGDLYKHNGLNGDAMLYRSWNGVKYYIVVHNNLLSNSKERLPADIKGKSDFRSEYLLIKYVVARYLAGFISKLKSILNKQSLYG